MARGCGRFRIGTIASAAVAAQLVAACGTLVPTSGSSSTEVPPPIPVPSGTPGPPDARSAEIATSAVRTFYALPGYRAQMRYYQKNGSRTSQGLYDLAGKPPRNLRINVREGSSAGTKLLWRGGSTIKARPKGLLSAIVVDLPLDDDRLVSVRGYRLDQSDIPALLKMLVDPRGRLAYAGRSGEDDVLTSAGSHLLPGCSKMIATFDASTSYPTAVDMTDGREVVFRLRLTGFRADRNVSLEI